MDIKLSSPPNTRVRSNSVQCVSEKKKRRKKDKEDTFKIRATRSRTDINEPAAIDLELKAPAAFVESSWPTLDEEIQMLIDSRF